MIAVLDQTPTPVVHGSPEWRAIRREYIGASEVAMLVGESPFGDAHDLYHSKVATVIEDDDSTAKRRGRHFEAATLAMYADEHSDVQVQRVLETVAHPRLPWIRASLDGLGIQDGVRFPIEAKSVHPTKADEWGEPGSDQVPAHYFIQAQIQCEVFDAPFAHMPAMFGFDAMHVFIIERDQQLGADLLDLCTEFREKYWLPRIEPPITGPNRERNLKRKFALPSDHMLTADDAQNELLAKYFDARGKREHWEEVEKQLKCDLIEVIGNNRGIIGREGRRITFGGQDGKKTYDFDGLCRALNVAADVRAQFIKTGNPFRTFRPTVSKKK